MLVIKEHTKDSKNPLEFPCLMESTETGSIYYITHIDYNYKNASGILLVTKGNQNKQPGSFSSTWYSPNLKPYEGTLEISNG